MHVGYTSEGFQFRKDHVEIRSRGCEGLRQDVLMCGGELLISCLAIEGGDEFLLLLHQRVWGMDRLRCFEHIHVVHPSAVFLSVP